MNKKNRGLEVWRSSYLHVVDKNCEWQSAPTLTLPHGGGKNCLMSGANLAIREGANVSCVSTDNSYSSKKRAAFTLAEVLITLGIIGVVAAMTMPTLVNNIKYHSYDNAKRKVLNSIGEAGKLLAIEGDLNGAADAEDFVKNRLSKKLSIAKMCDSAHLTDCGLPSTFYKTDGKTTMSMPTKMKGQTANTVFNYGSDETQAYADKNSYGFVTNNGYSVNLFYNGACEPDIKNIDAMSTGVDSGYKLYRIQNHMCFFAIYDMNGKGGPNVVGKDIGLVGVLYPNEETKAAAVLPADYDWSSAERGGARSTRTYATAPKACDDQFGKDYRMPDRDEAALMAMAGNLLGITDYIYWSGSVVGPGLGWGQYFHGGFRYAIPVTDGRYVRCVRR